MATTEVYRDIVDFLVDPKNLESAFDLIEVFPVALDRLHAKFWDTLKSDVEQRVNERETAWVTRLITEERVDAEGADFLKPGEGLLEIVPGDSDEMANCCCFWIQQNYRTQSRRQTSNGEAELFYGFGVSNPLTKRQLGKVSKEAKVLADRIGTEWISYREQLADGWLARKKLGYNLRAKHESIRLAQGNSLEKDVATALIKLFDERRAAVERINAAFRKSRARSAR